MGLVFNSSARGPSGLVVRASDCPSEGIGIKSQLDLNFFTPLALLDLEG